MCSAFDEEETRMSPRYTDVQNVSKHDVLACILQSEWHEQKLEEAKGHHDCSLMDILRSY